MGEVTNYSEILRNRLIEIVQNHGHENVIEKIKTVFQCKTSWAYKLRKQIIDNDISAFSRILYYQPHCSREDLPYLVAMWHFSWGNESTTIAGVKDVLNQKTITAEELRLMLSLAVLDKHVVFSADYLRSRKPVTSDSAYASVRFQPLTATKTLLCVRQNFEMRDINQAQLARNHAGKIGRSVQKVEQRLARLKLRKNSDKDRKDDPEYNAVQAVRVSKQTFTLDTLKAAKQQICRLQEDAQRVGMKVYAETHEGCDMKNFSGLDVEFLSADLVDDPTSAKPTPL